MRGGALPPALLCAALGFALAFAPRRAWVWALLALVAAAIAVSAVPPALAWRDTAFLGCWASIVVTALCVHLPRGPGPRLSLALGLNTGFWVGAVIAVAGERLDLVKSLPCALLCLPGAWAVARGWSIAVKVVASWLIAVALLAAGLTLVPTPGYVPDHMD